MYIDGVLGCVVGIMLIVGGYLFLTVILIKITEKIEKYIKWIRERDE